VSRVALYGATGHTGRLVAAALRPRVETLVLAGRDRARLDALAASLPRDVRVAVAPAHDAPALARAFEGCDVVVSCAGPFSTMGEPVVRAAIDAGADYLDSTGEQAFMRDIYERYESAARRRGVCVVNGHAFEIAVGDWAAAHAAAGLGPERLDRVTIAYAIDHMHPTRGTQLSAAESLSRGGVVWDHDRWRAVRPAAESLTFSVPELGERRAVSFPSGEIITVPRHIDTGRVQTYLSLGDGTAGRLGATGARLLGGALPKPIASYLRARAGVRHRQHAVDRPPTRFAISARARRGFDEAHVAVLGADPYPLTAHLLADATASLLSRRGDERPTGVLCPVQAFSAAELQRTLTSHGCRIFE
jgi:short subunit dehydrogenase-like uncharacterized protein